MIWRYFQPIEDMYKYSINAPMTCNHTTTLNSLKALSTVIGNFKSAFQLILSMLIAIPDLKSRYWQEVLCDGTTCGSLMALSSFTYESIYVMGAYYNLASSPLKCIKTISKNCCLNIYVGCKWFVAKFVGH